MKAIRNGRVKARAAVSSLRTRGIAAVLLSSVMLSGCQANIASQGAEHRSTQASSSPDGEAVPPDDEANGPVLNPSAKHVVRIHGRLPRHLRLAIYHRYKAENLGEDCSRIVGRGTLQIPMRHHMTVEAPIRHTGNRFESELVVDKYLPGPCEWRYLESRANVWKAPAPNPNRATLIVLSGNRYEVDDSVPRCDRPPRKDGTGCQEQRYWRLSNHDEAIPVQVRCRLERSDDPTNDLPPLYFYCQDLEDDSYKKRHLIMQFTRQVELNIYDLDVDAKPSPFQKELTP